MNVEFALIVMILLINQKVHALTEKRLKVTKAGNIEQKLDRQLERIEKCTSS